MMWDFQRDGLLPFERESIPAEQRIPVNEAMLNDLEPHLVQAEEVSVVKTATESVDDEGWSPLPPPTDGEDGAQSEASTAFSPASSSDLDDERAQLEAELARLDAERTHRTAHDPVATPSKDTALADLESRLSDLDF